MSNVKVTIVIPVYQVEGYIETCLTSVANQTYSGEIECVVVDDCGADCSWQIVENFISEYNGKIDFKLIRHTENKGLSAARNTGIAHATGEYIYFLDSDDAITPDCIELLSAPLKEHKYDFVIGDFRIIGNRQVTSYLNAEGAYFTGIKEAYYNKQWNVTAWNKLCNLAFLKQNNLTFKEGIIHEDILWSFYLANFARSMYALKLKTYIYNTREDSIMGSMKLTKSKDSKLVIYSEINRFLSEGDLYSHNQFSYLWRIKGEMFDEIRNWEFKYAKPYVLAVKKTTKVNPMIGYRLGIITLKALVKEFHIIMPDNIGCLYYRLINQLIRILK